MAKPLESIVNWIATHFRKDASKMLIWTGVAGWTLSSLAQISAILFNPKLSKEENGNTVYAIETRTLFSYIGNLFVYICIVVVILPFVVNVGYNLYKKRAK